MTITLMLFLALFVIGIQAAIPYLLKPTIAFGVTVPSSHTNEPSLITYKRLFTLITASFGIILIGVFTIWAFASNASEEKLILYGSAIQFAILFMSMALYFLFHAKTSRLKREQKWGAELKEVRITDITARTADEMLPWYLYLVPMIITIGMIAYTITQYANLPDLIPTHWGIDGRPDAFSEKTRFSAVALPLIILVMQVMILGTNEFTKKSGIKINAANKKKSRAQQLSFRKYSSWFLFATSLLMTILLSFLQLTTIHTEMGSPALLVSVPLGFLVLIFLLTGLYAFKVGQSGSRLDVNIVDEEVEGITNYDDDEYWKAGVFYFNKNDPSILVEKRFGVGWTMNFGRPLGYLILLGPILLILIISFLL